MGTVGRAGLAKKCQRSFWGVLSFRETPRGSCSISSYRYSYKVSELLQRRFLTTLSIKNVRNSCFFLKNKTKKEKKIQTAAQPQPQPQDLWGPW